VRRLPLLALTGTAASARWSSPLSPVRPARRNDQRQARELQEQGYVAAGAVERLGAKAILQFEGEGTSPISGSIIV
jgi:hypothetical protein